MLYWRIRIGGRKERYVAKGRAAVGWASRRASGERRWDAIALGGVSRRLWRRAGSGMEEAMTVTCCRKD